MRAENSEFRTHTGAMSPCVLLLIAIVILIVISPRGLGLRLSAGAGSWRGRNSNFWTHIRAMNRSAPKELRAKAIPVCGCRGANAEAPRRRDAKVQGPSVTVS